MTTTKSKITKHIRHQQGETSSCITYYVNYQTTEQRHLTRYKNEDKLEEYS